MGQSEEVHISDGTENDEDFEFQVGDKKAVETLIAEGINNMTLKERDLLYEELHGVENVIEETPEFLSDSLLALQQELTKIDEKPAYNQAEEANPEYMHDPKLRLMFLRAEYFDPKKAALRLVRFMEGKLAFFGPETLARPLLLNDLNEEDKKTLKSGILQIWPVRDRAGRAILSDTLSMFPRMYKDPISLEKTLLYLILKTAEDEETQKRGLIGIFFHMGTIVHSPDPAVFRTIMPTARWLPVRFTAAHICTDRSLMPIFLRAAVKFATKEFRLRTRIHEGTYTECRYTLMTFGIPVDMCPVTEESDLKTVNHMRWIKKRQAKDKAMKMFGTFNKVDLPGVNDVLIGKGKPFQQHPGNVALRQLVALYMNDYLAMKKSDKIIVAREVVKVIEENRKGRFLKKDDDGWWSIVTETEAREKVSKTFGSTKPPSRSLQKQEKQGFRFDGGKRARLEPDGCFCR